MLVKKETFFFLFASIFFFLALNLAPDFFDGKVKYLLLCSLVIIFGLPHGALDSLEAKHNKIITNKKEFIIFNLLYIFSSAIIFFSWHYVSLFMLSSFLFISVWHFGEDWKNKLKFIEGIILGLSIISFPVFFHEEKIIFLYSFLSSAENLKFLIFFQKNICYLLFFLSSIIIIKYYRDFNLCLQITIITSSAYLLDPIYYFISYFCFFHSIKNYEESLNSINMTKSNLIVITNTLLVIVVSLILYLFYLEGNIEYKISNLIFVGLASLTVPHMILKIIIKKRKSFFK